MDLKSGNIQFNMLNGFNIEPMTVNITDQQVIVYKLKCNEIDTLNTDESVRELLKAYALSNIVFPQVHQPQQQEIKVKVDGTDVKSPFLTSEIETPIINNVGDIPSALLAHHLIDEKTAKVTRENMNNTGPTPEQIAKWDEEAKNIQLDPGEDKIAQPVTSSIKKKILESTEEEPSKVELEQTVFRDNDPKNVLSYDEAKAEAIEAIKYMHKYMDHTMPVPSEADLAKMGDYVAKRRQHVDGQYSTTDTYDNVVSVNITDEEADFISDYLNSEDVSLHRRVKFSEGDVVLLTDAIRYGYDHTYKPDRGVAIIHVEDDKKEEEKPKEVLKKEDSFEDRKAALIKKYGKVEVPSGVKGMAAVAAAMDEKLNEGSMIDLPEVTPVKEELKHLGTKLYRARFDKELVDLKVDDLRLLVSMVIGTSSNIRLTNNRDKCNTEIELTNSSGKGLIITRHDMRHITVEDRQQSLRARFLYLEGKGYESEDIIYFDENGDEHSPEAPIDIMKCLKHYIDSPVSEKIGIRGNHSDVKIDLKEISHVMLGVLISSVPVLFTSNGRKETSYMPMYLEALSYYGVVNAEEVYRIDNATVVTDSMKLFLLDPVEKEAETVKELKLKEEPKLQSNMGQANPLKITNQAVVDEFNKSILGDQQVVKVDAGTAAGISNIAPTPEEVATVNLEEMEKRFEEQNIQPVGDFAGFGQPTTNVNEIPNIVDTTTANKTSEENNYVNPYLKPANETSADGPAFIDTSNPNVTVIKEKDNGGSEYTFTMLQPGQVNRTWEN